MNHNITATTLITIAHFFKLKNASHIHISQIHKYICSTNIHTYAPHTHKYTYALIMTIIASLTADPQASARNTTAALTSINFRIKIHSDADTYFAVAVNSRDVLMTPSLGHSQGQLQLVGLGCVPYLIWVLTECVSVWVCECEWVYMSTWRHVIENKIMFWPLSLIYAGFSA